MLIIVLVTTPNDWNNDAAVSSDCSAVPLLSTRLSERSSEYYGNQSGGGGSTGPDHRRTHWRGLFPTKRGAPSATMVALALGSSSAFATTMKLVKFLQKLNREQVTIELKNGTVVQGTVVGVDATMNCHLKKAKVTVYVLRGSVCSQEDLVSHSFFDSRGKNPVAYATLSVRGSTMRAWLLPESLNLDALLVEEAPVKTPRPPPAGGRGRGRGRGGRMR